MSTNSAAAGSNDGTTENRTGSLQMGEDHCLSNTLPDVMTFAESSSLPSGSLLPMSDLPRKRKGDIDDREPHRQIEKRRRDKMNNLIDELSVMIPACSSRTQKHDKLTVLRMAVQHLKSLKGARSSFADTNFQPSFLLQDDLKYLVLRGTEGFLFVVTCDGGKILFTSESVSNILNFSRLELDGQSLFDYVHPKDISKVKEQLSASELYPRERLIDAKTGLQVQTDQPIGAAHLCTGARRSFFFRMKHCRAVVKMEEKASLPNSSKKKESQRYCTVHCTGYMRSWPSSQLNTESDVDKEGSYLTCLVAMCRVHPHISYQPTPEVTVKPTEFVTRYAIDGKFTFVDQQATTITGYLPHELLGTSCYEYIHQDDLLHLAERHRTVLHSKEKIGTRCYKFKTKHASFVMLQSQWFRFINPCTKEVEFIVSNNRVVSRPNHTDGGDESGKSNSSKVLEEESKCILPIIPGISSDTGTVIYAGSIGTQIANELIDSNRLNSSPSSGNASPFFPLMEGSPLVPCQASSSVSNTENTPGGSGLPSLSRAESFSGDQILKDTGEASELDLDSMVVPGISNLGNDEAAMEVIMSLLNTDANLGDAIDYDDLHWSL